MTEHHQAATGSRGAQATIIVVAPNAEFPAEAESLAARIGAKVLRAGEIVLWLRQLEHALRSPLPAPQTNSLLRPVVAPETEAEPSGLTAEELAEELRLMTDEVTQ